MLVSLFVAVGIEARFLRQDLFSGGSLQMGQNYRQRSIHWDKAHHRSFAEMDGQPGEVAQIGARHEGHAVHTIGPLQTP